MIDEEELNRLSGLNAIGANYADATVKGSPYREVDYEIPTTVMYGAKAESMNWLPVNLPVAGLVAKYCRHEAGPKDGAALVLAKMIPGRRVKTAVEAVTGIGGDIDDGTPEAEIDEKLDKAGILAIRYTTHSHGRTQTEFRQDEVIKFFRANGIDEGEFTTTTMRRYCTEKKAWHSAVAGTVEFERIEHKTEGIMVVVVHGPISKNRIIVPLAAPYVIADEGAQQEALQKWAQYPEALANMLGLTFDKSCSDPCRLFYLPRHDVGREYSISLFGGPPLRREQLSIATGAGDGRQGKSKSKTERGKALGKWSLHRARGFQIVDVIEHFAPDRIRGGATTGRTIECPFEFGHSNPNDTRDTGFYAVNADLGKSFIASCRHESCSSYSNLDFLGKMIEDCWFEETLLWEDDYNAVELTAEQADFGRPTMEEKGQGGYGDALAFETERGVIPAGVSYNKEDKSIHKTWRNALLLIGHEKWNLGYNELTQVYEMRGQTPFPWPPHLGHAFNDTIRREIRLYLLRRWGVTFKIQDVEEATLTLARRNAFNPVCDYLADVEPKWDRKPRVDTWLETYLGVKITDATRNYVRAIGKIVLVAAARRARQPGCKFDEMLILEGPQGCGKSTAVRILGGEWFSDANLGDLTDKKAAMKLRGVWLQEMSELAGMRKAEVDVLKEFMSYLSDKYKIPYATFEEDFPRRCIFFGTVNPGGGAYLVDLTGNRRFWPVACGTIDLGALERDRDQLWAEAAMMESRGDLIRLDESLYDAAKAEQDARLADDPWVERLAIHLEALKPSLGKRVLSISLLSDALDIPTDRQGQPTMKKLKGAMSVIDGWEYKASMRADGVKSAGYEYVGLKPPA